MVSLDVRQLSNSEMLNRVEAAENAGESEIWGRSRKYGILAIKYASVAPKVNNILSRFLLDYFRLMSLDLRQLSNSDILNRSGGGR